MLTTNFESLFCSECHEQYPPEYLEKYNNHYLCARCEDDLDIYPEGLQEQRP